MAIYHVSVSNINRTNQSAVAASSYRSGDSLFSERDGETKNYKKRDVMPESFILSPKHAPDWTNERQTLWNEVERKEKNVNARLAREITVALPKELNNEEQTDLIKDYCTENFVEEGMVSDVSIHRDKEHNPHAHIMLTTRSFDINGEWEQKKKRQKVLDEQGNFVLDQYGKPKDRFVSLTNWNDKETLVKWRESFAEKCNQALKEKGIDMSISHKSFADQGIDKVPTIHLGHAAFHMEQKAKKKAEQNHVPYIPVTEKGQINQEANEINNELEELKKQKVISLEEYENQKVASVKDSRFSDVEKESLSKLSKIIKGEINYEKLIEQKQRLSNWTKSLESKSRQLQSEKDIINKAVHVFKNDKKSNVSYYGFSPKSFNEQVKSSIQNLKTEEEKFAKRKEQKDELETLVFQAEKAIIRTSKIDFENHKPDYLEDNFDKYPYARYTLLKEIKNNNLPSEEINLQEKIKQHIQKDNEIHGNDKDKETLKELNQQSIVTDRTMKKYKQAYQESINNNDEVNAYKQAIKINELDLQKQSLDQQIEHYKESLKEELLNSGESLTSKEKEDIEAMSAKDLTQAYENYQNDEPLTKDTSLDESSSTSKENDRLSPSMNPANDVLSSIDRAVQDMERKQKDDVTNQEKEMKKKKRRGRNTQEKHLDI